VGPGSRPAYCCRYIQAGILCIRSCDPFRSFYVCLFHILCRIIVLPGFFPVYPIIDKLHPDGKSIRKGFAGLAGGMLSPLFLTSALLWFMKHDVALFWGHRLENFKQIYPAKTLEAFSISGTVMVALIALLVMLSLFIRLVRRDTTTTVNVSRFYSSMFWFVLFSCLVMLTYTGFAYGYIPIMMIPVSLLITSLFTGKRFFGSVLMISLLIIASLVYYVCRVFLFPY